MSLSGRGVAALRNPAVVKAFKALVVGATALSVLSALAKYGRQLAGRLEHVSLGYLLLATAAAFAYRIVNAYGWVLVLRSLGQPIRAATGMRIWLTTETLRWLPGSVWGLVSRAAQANALGVPAVPASLSLPLELGLSIVSWGLVAAAGLGLSGTARALASRVPPAWLALALGAIVLLAASGFALARWFPSGALARKVKGMTSSLAHLRTSPPRPGWIAAALAFFTGLGFFNGAAFMAVLASTSDVHPGLLASAGINATGWLLGFFAFFAPSGLGVREGGTTAMLAPLMPLDAAVAAAILWRVIQVVVELVCLAACFAPRAFERIRRPAGRPTGQVGECEKVG